MAERVAQRANGRRRRLRLCGRRTDREQRPRGGQKGPENAHPAYVTHGEDESGGLSTSIPSYNFSEHGQGRQARAGGGRPAAAGSRTSQGRERQPRSKSALVLGGGGFTGGVYEIGALRALDLLSVNRTVNEFDVYVGTSAGSFVAAAVANGVTPEEMMRVIDQQVPTPFPDVDLELAAAPELHASS